MLCYTEWFLLYRLCHVIWAGSCYTGCHVIQAGSYSYTVIQCHVIRGGFCYTDCVMLYRLGPVIQTAAGIPSSTATELGTLPELQAEKQASPTCCRQQCVLQSRSEQCD